jgi:hypothetical protein
VPAVRGAVERGRRDARVQLDVAPEVEAVGDVVQVAEDLRLRGVALGPLPVLLEQYSMLSMSQRAPG